jgi:hypothetical protein
MVAWVERAGVALGETKRTGKTHVAWWVCAAAVAAALVVAAHGDVGAAVPHVLLAVSAWTCRTDGVRVVSDAWMRCAWGAALSLSLSPLLRLLVLGVVALSLVRGRHRHSEEAALKLWLSLCAASVAALLSWVVVGAVAQPLWQLLFLMLMLGAFPLHGFLSDTNTAMPDPVLYPTLAWCVTSTVLPLWPHASFALLVSAVVLLWMAFHENSIGRLFALAAMAAACMHHNTPASAAGTSALLLLSGGHFSGLTWESMSGAGRARPVLHGVIIVAAAVAMGVPATPLFFVRIAEAMHDDGMRSVVACGAASVLSGLCVLRLCVFLFSKSPRSR